MQNCKQKQKTKNTKTNKKKLKETRKPRRPTGPECLRHRVVFFVFFVLFSLCLQFCMPQGKDAESWVLSFVCSFACPKGRMQRVESCHLLVFLSVNAYVKTQNVQRGVQKAHSGDPLFCFFFGGGHSEQNIVITHNHSDPAGGFLSHGGSQNHPSHYLVGGIPTPLKNMSSSVGMMKFPIYGKRIHSCSKPPTSYSWPLIVSWTGKTSRPSPESKLNVNVCAGSKPRNGVPFSTVWCLHFITM